MFNLSTLSNFIISKLHKSSQFFTGFIFKLIPFEVPGHQTMSLREDIDKIFNKFLIITSGDVGIHGLDFRRQSIVHEQLILC